MDFLRPIFGVHPSEDFDAETYDRINRSQIEDAKDTLRRILLDGFGTVATIVDIGCGSGSVTRLVAETISHERILALDVDPAMIQLARQNQHPPTIEFLVQDISVPFDQLDPKLQELEGKVDLIWSNRVIHWIPEKDRPQAAENIRRLLKPGGKGYINTTFAADFTLVGRPEEREKINQVMRVPSRNEQEDNWVRSFRTAGFSAVNIEFAQKSFDLGSPEDLKHTREFIQFYHRYLPDTMTKEEKDKFLEPFKDDFLRSYAGPIGSPLLEKENLATHSVYYYALFHIVITK